MVVSCWWDKMIDDKFQVGDEVVVAKALGKLNGRVGDDYFYGGDLRQIPLGSLAVVKAVDYYKGNYYCHVSFPEFHLNYYMHVDELELADEMKVLETRLLGFKQIGKHPLFELFDNSKMILSGGKVYSLDDSEQNLDLSGNYFRTEQSEIARLTREGNYEVVRKSNPVVYLGELSLFEELMQTRYSNEISKTKEIYAKKISDEMHLNEIFDKEMSVPQLIFKKVFPYLRTKKYEDKLKTTIGIEELDEKTGEQTVNENEMKVLQKQKLETIVRDVLKTKEELMEKIRVEKLKETAKKDRERHIDELLMGTSVKHLQRKSDNLLEDLNVAILDGNVYDLIEDSKGSFPVVNLEGKTYSLQRSSLSLKDIEKSYKFELGKKIKIDSLNEYFSKEKLANLLNDADELKCLALLDSIKEQNTYQEEDFGFIKHRGEHYIFLDVPAFAVKSFFDEKYYFFDKTEIAVNVYKENNGQLKYGSLVVTKNNNNPILHGVDHDFSIFCTGFNRIPYEGKDVGDIIAKQLRKGKDILLYGYLKPRLHCDELREICAKCGKKHFEKHIKTLDELEKMSVQIFQGENGANYCG